MNYIQRHTKEKVYITVINRQHCRKKHRYVELTNNVQQLLDEYNQQQKIVYQSD